MKHEILVYNKTRKRIPKDFIENVISRVLNFLKLKQPEELAVLVVGKSEIKRLNKIWRHKNYTPDELSFGLNSREKWILPTSRQVFAKTKNKVLGLGEIVISSGRIHNKKKLTAILIHSLLHLLGYNHEKSVAKAKKMEQEEKILSNLEKF